MLTDIISEEEFEIKEEEPWFDQQDLQHDLQLAAELGKTLLERNHELEQGLQQMYTTNQEQLQEIEHLSKQVDLLRSVNDQHAKVYEQLDATARDLEQSNQRLVLENRSDQDKIERLTETINGLHSQVEELQRELATMKTQQSVELLEPQRNPLHEHPEVRSASSLEDDDWEEEENTIQMLQTQLNAERGLREAAEQEAKTLAREISQLEPQLSLLEGYKSRLAELETEVEELRQQWHWSTVSWIQNTVFFPSWDEASEILHSGRALRRCSSERQLREAGDQEKRLKNGDSTNGYRNSQTGISLLNEVDAQYSALQRKYDTLLRRSKDGPQSMYDKAVQTPTAGLHKLTRCRGVSSQESVPEYKVIFSEIFTCIQKSKEDIGKNRDKTS